uniref:GP-PDE domain-containing protein n=1 Tax=Trieres chinensis TaxID=1514140 RepID=A0A7S2E8I7_TRICV|mmetsp:Transcript_11951/g.24884  ORF Transcript_11951/g.24884 Transcript_11951/m.24884 type:complete len:464 (+) Transcript_11951:122-1513(+)
MATNSCAIQIAEREKQLHPPRVRHNPNRIGQIALTLTMMARNSRKADAFIRAVKPAKLPLAPSVTPSHPAFTRKNFVPSNDDTLSNKLKVSTSSVFQSSFNLTLLFGPLENDDVTVTSTSSSFSDDDFEGDYSYIHDTATKFPQTPEKQSLAAKLNVLQQFLPLGNSNQRPLVVGHRGAMYLEPENTLGGFHAAAEVGADAIELDVFLLKCGTLVVFHGDGNDKSPGWLTNYCGINENILDFTAEEARSLRFDPSCPEFVCPEERLHGSFIPTLEEVLLDAKETGIYVKIELKGPGTEIPTLKLVERMGMVDQCSFASFEHSRVENIRKMRPDRLPDGTYKYKTGCLFASDVPDNFIETSLSVGASEVHLKYDTCTKDRVTAIHKAGMKSMAWFRGAPGMREDATHKYWDIQDEDSDCYDTVIKTGVQALCVNKPNLLHQMVQKYGFSEEHVKNVDYELAMVF